MIVITTLSHTIAEALLGVTVKASMLSSTSHMLSLMLNKRHQWVSSQCNLHQVEPETSKLCFSWGLIWKRARKYISYTFFFFFSLERSFQKERRLWPRSGWLLGTPKEKVEWGRFGAKRKKWAVHQQTYTINYEARDWPEVPDSMKSRRWSRKGFEGNKGTCTGSHHPFRCHCNGDPRSWLCSRHHLSSWHETLIADA